eukprot:3497-Heterococcus_DN1.PRE.1
MPSVTLLAFASPRASDCTKNLQITQPTDAYASPVVATRKRQQQDSSSNSKQQCMQHWSVFYFSM